MSEVSLELLDSLRIDHGYARKFSLFLDLFEKWNRSINLSAASTRADLLEHLEDSLHVIPHLRTARRVLDVGSGGGFPVAIAAICLPDTAFTSLEPVHKKHAFLKTVSRELPLPNLVALAERLEDHELSDYDAATSRATFDLRDWLTFGLGRVSASGVVIGFEAAPRSDLPASVERHPYPFRDKQRALVLLRSI